MAAKGRTYEDSGVSINKGDSFAQWIASQKSKAVSKSLGGFAGGIELNLRGVKKPVLLSTTDGVGTKLLVAQKLGIYNTVGIDLVAMCVNDLAVCGAQPLSFLDYIAVGHINEQLLKALMEGIIQGCEQADCELSGGETAEMPDLYGSGDFDLAGFCTGVVDKEKMLPLKQNMQAGDPIYGIASTGLHSNGYSLARKVLEGSLLSVWQEALTPTRIYVRELMTLHRTGLLNGAAHITGGGLEGNFERVVPENLKAEFTWDWPRAPIFDRIMKDGPVALDEMRRVFNMGVGIAMTCSQDKAGDFEKAASDAGIDIFPMGTLRNA